MEGDKAHFSTLQAQRRKEERKLKLQRYHVIVDENNVVKELLEVYCDDEAISSHKLVVSIRREQANCGGLTQKLYFPFLGIILFSIL